MIDDFDFSKFAMEIERTATALLGDAPMDDELIQACRVVQEMAETTLARFRDDASLVACGPGCAHCCAVNVAVLQPEAVTIVAFLERKLSASQLAELEEQIDELLACIGGLDDEGRIWRNRPCALLDAAGSCSVAAAGRGTGGDRQPLSVVPLQSSLPRPGTGHGKRRAPKQQPGDDSGNEVPPGCPARLRPAEAAYSAMPLQGSGPKSRLPRWFKPCPE